MNTTRITDDFTVSSQIMPEEVAQIAALGFRSIMCNRPDGEEYGQPAFAEIADAAKLAGLRTSHVPVISGRIAPQDVAAFQAAIADLPGPVFAYCRSGARCQNLWQLAI